MKNTLCTILLLFAIAITAESSAKQKTKLEIEPTKGTTVYGQITCEGKPLPNVTVSDGALFTKTDSLGVYMLQSFKFYGSVFVVTPSGYEPVCRNNIFPKFWAPLDRRHIDKVERHDFEYRRCDNRRHKMVVTTNMRISYGNESLLQTKRVLIPAVKRIANESQRDSIPTYSITLGDISNNNGWYSQEFDLSDIMQVLKSFRYPFPLYTVIGDDDHDAAIEHSPLVDHLSEGLYEECFGPRFYSMNIGDIHYVVLDNTVFRNEAGSGSYATDIKGKRNYDRRFSADQLAWLRRELAQIEDKSTPIVICTHHTVTRSTSKGKLVKALTKPADTDSLLVCLADFESVHILSGHTRRRRLSVQKEMPNIIEHSISPASGNDWETLYNGFPHIGPDGCDAGIEIFSIDGRDIKWEYRSIQSPERTFRAYDMRSVGKYYRDNEHIRAIFNQEKKNLVDYGAKSFGQYIYLNFWQNEEGASIKAFSGNDTLKVVRVSQNDPLFFVASNAIRQRNARGRKITHGRNQSMHLFRVKIDSTVQWLRIRTTDRFGRTFEDSLDVSKPLPFPPTHKRF